MATQSLFRAKNGLIAADITYPTVDGTAGQHMVTDGAGTLSFTNVNADTIVFAAKNVNGNDLPKGTVVYVSGISGNTPEIRAARSNSSSTMPAFGILQDDIVDTETGNVVTFGSLRGLSVTDFGESGITFALGDTIYVSASEAGKLTNVAPAGEANQIQNIGRIERASPTTNMTIKVGGAGRSAATPALNDGNIFIGNSSNQSSTASFNTLVDNRLSSGNVSDITITGALNGPATFTIDPAAVGDNTGTVVIAGNLQVDGTTTTINSTTLTVDDKNIVLGSGSANAAAADGAGISVDIAGVTNPEWNWYVNSVNTGVSAWESNYPVVITQASTGRTTNLHLVNETSVASTEVALEMSVISPANDACDVRLVAHRKGSNAGSDFYIETTNSSSAIERHFTILEDGNVGIGTDSPDEKLHIHSTSDTTIKITDGVIGSENYGGYIKGFGVSGSGGRLQLGSIDADVETLAVEIQEQANGLHFRTKNGTNGISSRRLTILGTSGNVGIGTDSPASTLDAGYTRIYNSGAASSPSSGKGLEVHYVTSGRTQGEGAYLIPYDRDNSQYKPLTIDAQTIRLVGGNTLIADNLRTDSFVPSQRLHVYDPSTAYILAETGGTGTSAGHRSTAGSNDWVWFATEGQPNYRLYDYSSSAVRLTVENNGRVGIGTEDPFAKVHSEINAVSGAGAGTSGVLWLRNANETNGNAATIFWGDDEAAAMGAINLMHDNYSSNYGSIKIDTRGPSGYSTKLTIDSSGHLLPGTNTQDLGSTSNPWQNIYTQDLNLSNEKRDEGNSVDGTKGNWTIQEGDEHLYIINNKSGKKYRFALEEIE